jgi:hemoglobin
MRRYEKAMNTLWEQLGGTQNMERIINDFIDRAISDPEVNYSRNGHFVLDDAAIEFSKKKALEFISSAAGGPLQYSGRSLAEIHQGMQISNLEFDAVCKAFHNSLQRNGIGPPLSDLVMAKVEETRKLIVSSKR